MPLIVIVVHQNDKFSEVNNRNLLLNSRMNTPRNVLSLYLLLLQ